MSSRYEVQIARRALKTLNSLERREQQRMRAAIDLLAEQPRPPACVALAGEDDVYRVGVGDYRIVYEIVDRRLLILVVLDRHLVRVGHRRDVYR